MEPPLWRSSMVCWSLTVNGINTVSINGAIAFHFTFVYFGNLHAYIIIIFFISRTTNTMEFGFWQGKTIGWSSTGIICTNVACIIKSINSTTWIEPSGMSFWTKYRLRRTFTVCEVDGFFRSAFGEPFWISFVFAGKIYNFCVRNFDLLTLKSSQIRQHDNTNSILFPN